MERFPDCKALIPFLRKPGVIVEKELARVREQAENFPQAHRELAAIRYYLHVALWECQKRWYDLHRGITNYATLVREIERWRWPSRQRVLFVTFNYDTMLESAMTDVLHHDFSDLDRYIGSDYALFKPHGSINWGRELDVPPRLTLSPQGLIDYAAELQFSHKYRVVTAYPMCTIANRVVFPALSIPVEQKDEFSCPRSHLDTLEKELPSITKVVTIGWRATEMDFLKMLRTKLGSSPHLMIVSGDQEGAQDTLANLAGTWRLANPVVTGFSGLITRDFERLWVFLNQP
jgi:hypothetical protein